MQLLLKVKQIKDLVVGMELEGIVTNVANFGAFVDIGVHQDGLVHISELSNRFVKDAGEVVKVHQRVMVKVLDVDIERKRISLSMKDGAPQPEGVTKGEGRKKEEKGKEKGQRQKEKQRSTFTNNPFADIFGKKS